MELYIETLTGTGYVLRVSPTEPIICVKAEIQRLEGIPLSHQHLIWRSVELEDEYNLDDYKIHDGATLKLVLAMRGGPINTRRISTVPIEDPSFREMAEYVEANEEEFGSNRQVTLLVFKEGDQLNFFRVVDRGDGTLTPLSESLSGTSVYNNLNEEEEDKDVLVRDKVDENLKLKEKVQELHLRMEQLSLNKKPMSQQPQLHLPQPPSIGVSSSRPVRRRHNVSRSGTSRLNRNPLLPPVGQTFSSSHSKISPISELLPCLSLPNSARKSFSTPPVPLSPDNDKSGKMLSSDDRHVSPDDEDKIKVPLDQKETYQTPLTEIGRQSGIRYKILNRLKTDQQPNVMTNDDMSSLCCGGGELVQTFDQKLSSVAASPVSSEQLVKEQYLDNVELSSPSRDHHLQNYLKSETLAHVSCDTVSPSIKSPPQKSTQTFSSAVPSSTEGGADMLSVRDYSNHKLVMNKLSPDPCGLVSATTRLKKRQERYMQNLRDAFSEPAAATVRVGSSKEKPRTPDPSRRLPPSTSSRCDWKKEFSLESLSRSEAYAVTGMLRQASLERIGSSHIGNFIHSSMKGTFSAGNGNLKGAISNPDQGILSSHLDKITCVHDSSDLSSPTNVHHRLPPVKPKKPRAKRCLTCGKKTGIASSYSCRCGNNFCTLHRYAESHNCPFDYKTEGRRLLEKNNPLVTAPKLPKI